jgi:hypothetical protein
VIKFHANSSFENRDVQCGVTDRQTETTKLIGAFDNLSNVPKNYSVLTYGLFPCIFKKMVAMVGNRVQTFYVYIVGT